MAPTLKQLLVEPFGPYRDSDILSSSYRPRGTNLPQLSRLKLRQDGHAIGLDRCERYLDPPEKASSPVFFCGVLIFDQLAWLSETGKTYLERDLNDRDVKASRSTQRRRLTLQGLYGQAPAGGLKIKAWIRCEKETPAMYMTASGYPKSLLLNAKDEHRSYEIRSMDHFCYRHSVNFLDRYRLVALISEIIDKPEYNLGPNTLEIETLVGAYLLKHKEGNLSHSVIFAEDDDTPREAQPRLRHVSRAEVRGCFAAHSGWLLAFYLRKPRSTCPINIRAWCGFISKVRVAKQCAASGNWGDTYEDDEIWSSDSDESPAAIAKTLAKFGGTVAKWESRLVNAITKPVPTMRRPCEDDDEASQSTRRSRRGEFTYDSDFSEVSTPGCSDSEYDSDSPRFSFLPHSHLLHMSSPPALRPGRFIWDCPVPQCTYSLDFLKLSGPDADVYDTNVRKKKFLDLSDVNVQTVLRRRVSEHYLMHLEVNSASAWRDKQKLLAALTKKWNS